MDGKNLEMSVILGKKELRIVREGKEDIHPYAHTLDFDDNKKEIKVENSLPKNEMKTEEVKRRRSRGRAKASVVLGSCNCPICKKSFVVVDMDSEIDYRKHVFYHRVLSFK